MTRFDATTTKVRRRSPRHTKRWGIALLLLAGLACMAAASLLVIHAPTPEDRIAAKVLGAPPTPEASARTPELRVACNASDAQACFDLGVLVVHSQGDVFGYGEARRLFTLACDWDHPHACWNLAIFCENGLATPVDTGRAASLYQKACDLGLPEACAAATDVARTRPHRERHRP